MTQGIALSTIIKGNFEMNTQRPNSPLSNYQYNTTAYDHRTLDDLLYNAKLNLNELIKLIDRLFELHSRILVIRIDLNYKTEVRNTVSIETVQMHREQLLADRRKYPDEFKGLLGYAWCLEQGEKEGGYHHHLLAFYNGAERIDGIGIGEALRNLWDTITNGNGHCYISNFDKRKLEMEGRWGIGMIHRDNVALRINLIENVATYITKKCTAFDIQSGRTESGQFRTFGKSQTPKPLDPNIPRRGRPPVRDGSGW